MVNNTSVLFEKHLKGFFEAILLQRCIQELMDFLYFVLIWDTYSVLHTVGT